MASDMASAVVVDGHAKIDKHFSKRFKNHIFLINHDNIRQFCKENL